MSFTDLASIGETGGMTGRSIAPSSTTRHAFRIHGRRTAPAEQPQKVRAQPGEVAGDQAGPWTERRYRTVNWLWLNVPLMAVFFLAMTGVPLWLVSRHPDTGP